MENQRNYQALFRDSNANEPFVGLIIGPYDVAMLGPTSAITGEISSAQRNCTRLTHRGKRQQWNEDP